MHIAARGLIFDATDAAENEAVAYVTSLVPLASGTFLCGWQSGPGKHTPTNTIRLARSTDGAQNWDRLPFEFETSFEGIPGSVPRRRNGRIRTGTIVAVHHVD